jgi:hypothetical protein
MAMEGYPRATKIPVGWSAQPPNRIDQYQIRRPAVLSQYLSYLPRIFARPMPAAIDGRNGSTITRSPRHRP